MKKFLLTLTVFVLMCCDIKVEPRAISAEPNPDSNSNPNSEQIILHYGSYLETIEWRGKPIFQTYEFHGMEYGFFFYSSTYKSSMYVVNITKDELEVEKLRLEIQKIKADTIPHKRKR